MRPLSERLEEIATHYDGDCCDSCDAKIISAIREGAQLAKRYEDAPVGECVACDFEGYERPTWHVIDDREAVPLTLRGRVRILLDTEGA